MGVVGIWYLLGCAVPVGAVAGIAGAVSFVRKGRIRLRNILGIVMLALVLVAVLTLAVGAESVMEGIGDIIAQCGSLTG